MTEVKQKEEAQTKGITIIGEDGFISELKRKGEGFVNQFNFAVGDFSIRKSEKQKIEGVAERTDVSA